MNVNPNKNFCSYLTNGFHYFRFLFFSNLKRFFFTLELCRFFSFLSTCYRMPLRTGKMIFLVKYKLNCFVKVLLDVLALYLGFFQKQILRFGCK